MPELNWIGKAAVVTHHKDVPFRLLEPDADLSCGDPQSGNLIVEGDNLHALKALLPRYAGTVKCIYIDPPYNTGNEGWVYNDNVNAPEIKKWLGETVGKESEDLTRHDKWLCMMYPRLALLKQFLAEDGAIFVSIDDNEVASLRLMMDEIFGKRNFVANIIWNHSVQSKGYTNIISLHHNHTIAYGLSGFQLLGVPRSEEHNKNYSNPDNDPRGRWRSGDVRNSLHRPNLQYNITTPSGKIIKHPPNGWRFAQETFHRELASGKIMFSKDETRIIRKIYLADQKRRAVESLWFAKDVGTTREASQEVGEILRRKQGFETPKPTRLIQRILQIASDGPSLILDSFAGSGTTAHAVLKQNAADGGKRKFILVEMEPNIAKEVTAERVRRVIEGYTNSKGETVPGLGGGFQYCRLSEEPLFDEYGGIREDVSFAQLAEFVWFVETGTGFPNGIPSSSLLGIYEGRAIYLLYNGILKDRKVNGGNILTGPVFSALPKHEGPKVIYAAANRLGGPRCDREQITFKQTPYALDV